jgi:hypothetical protein
MIELITAILGISAAVVICFTLIVLMLRESNAPD